MKGESTVSNNRFKPLECRGARLTGRAGFFDPSKLPEGASPEDAAEAERQAYRTMKAGKAARRINTAAKLNS